MYIPPFANVRLIECRDFMALTPVVAYREFYGYGKIKVREVSREGVTGLMLTMLTHSPGDDDIWVVMSWKRFEDGHEEPGLMEYLFMATEDEARKATARLIRFHRKDKEALVALSQLFKAKDEDLAYIENRFPNLQSPPTGPHSTDAHDVYQARLKVMAGLHPKAVELIHQADAEKDSNRRAKLEREAVQAYYAELAHSWTEDEVKEWQRNNPIGTEWICEFARVFEEPERNIEPINYELALNWIRKNYNLLTAEELSDAILERTGQRLMPGTLKKRRERLGLTTKREPGPRPNEGQ